jgi:methyl-accepting chemotaxis protein
VSKLSEQAATVSEAADQMGSVIEHTTNATLSVTEQVKSASTQIEKNYDLAGKLEQNFNNVNLAVDAGNKDAALVRTELQEMSGIVMSAQEATDSLLEEMKTITNILGEINAIASKTNLLSLNASIEAARAGEHGKGFAVVADEIRNLSQQSSDASNNIKSIIERLAETTNTVSEKITAGAQAAVNGVERMGKLLEVFDGIKYTADNANKVVSEEYQVIEAVKSNFDDINKEIETLVATTEENTAMITNIAESISRQHESVGSVENEIISISDLSGTLKEHFSAE